MSATAERPARSAALPGLDLRALQNWLDQELPGLRRGDLSATIVSGGKSNLTYRITDGVAVWALRRPPLSHVLPTAHDMVREYSVISALAPTDVAVPRPVALCRDEDVLGQPFYLMDFVEGVVVQSTEQVDRLDYGQAAHVCQLLVDELSTLHEVDYQAVGLTDFGRPAGYLRRQISRWHRQWLASQTRDLVDVAHVVSRLETARPVSARTTVVHGDYRLSNVLLSSDLARVAAVVDWELSTIGDPLADLGLFAVYQQLSLLHMFDLPAMSIEDGFMSVDEILSRYATSSGQDLGRLDWYLGLAYFKLAVISEGIHRRYLDGTTVGAGFDDVGEAVPWLMSQARRALV